MLQATLTGVTRQVKPERSKTHNLEEAGLSQATMMQVPIANGLEGGYRVGYHDQGRLACLGTRNRD